MPVASAKFVKEEMYAKKPSLFIMIAGVIGVIIAAKLVKEMPLDILRWLVIVVVTYTGISMLIAAKKEKDKQTS